VNRTRIANHDNDRTHLNNHQAGRRVATPGRPNNQPIRKKGPGNLLNIVIPAQAGIHIFALCILIFNIIIACPERSRRTTPNNQ
jgi:hypothetical protein